MIYEERVEVSDLKDKIENLVEDQEATILSVVPVEMQIRPGFKDVKDDPYDSEKIRQIADVTEYIVIYLI